jgi:hypothetical protein
VLRLIAINSQGEVLTNEDAQANILRDWLQQTADYIAIQAG